MSANKWRLFVRNSVLRRVPEEDFASYSTLLKEQHPLNGRKISRTIFDCRRSICSPSDPIVFRYIRALITRTTISTTDVLLTVLEEWTLGRDFASDEGRDLLATRLEADALVIQELAVQSAARHHSETDARICFVGCAKLLNAIVPHVGKSNEGKDGAAVSLDPALSLVEAICLLFATISTIEVGVAVLTDHGGGSFRDEVGQLFVAAAPFLPMMSMELRQRLDEVQKGFAVGKESSDKDINANAQPPPPNPAQFEMNTMDQDSIRARASLYVYLNAALSSTPKLDDASLMTFLMSRYQGDFLNMTIHLILASFDLLANGHHKNEPTQTMDLYHSYITNKLPLLLSYISKSAIDHIPFDACITQAYGRIDITVFPAFSSTFDLSNKDAPYADVRAEFLFSCALQELIPESSIETLLGESSMMTVPSHGRYVRANLVQQMTSNAKRAEQLIEELESYEGNAGAVAGAVVDVIHRLCNERETMTLKQICLQIVRKPRRLDVVMLFHSPASFVHDLSEVLDGWKIDEDQGESQPVYDEFGGILLLVLAARYRYGLTVTDLGITNANSFVLKLFDQVPVAKHLDQLGDSAKHLGSWISALFVADSLNDELMSGCSPQEFYLLVPTLFNQCLTACNMGKLTIDALKTGFEYLLEGFLLPSLLIALLYLTYHIRTDDPNPKTTLQLLYALVKPSSGSTEVREVHQTIVSIAAEPIKQALQSSRHVSMAPDAQAILKLLASYDNFRRASTVPRAEADAWCSTPGGLAATIRNSVQTLVLWDVNQISASPPAFTFKLFNLGVRLHGVSQIFQILLDELKSQQSNGTLDLTLDIFFAIICAPTTASSSLTFQDVLRLERNNLSRYLGKAAPATSSGNNIIAESLVRLNRRLDNYSLIVPPQPLDTSVDAATAAAAAAAAAIPDDLASLDLTNINMEAANANGNIDASLAGGTGAQGQNSSTNDASTTKDLIDQMLDSHDTLTAGTNGHNNNSKDLADPNNTGTSPDFNLASLDPNGANSFGDITGMFDLDSANLGLGNDFDLEMEGMF